MLTSFFAPASQPPLGIVIVGAGTVGGSVLDVLRENAQTISARSGRNIVVRAVVVRNIEKARTRLHPDMAGLLTDDWQAAVQRPDDEVLLELMGGESTAKECIQAALTAGKSVVTANKALLATCGDVIFDAAHAAGKPVAYEAAVAGCIPIIKTLREALAGDTVHEVAGIINGTSNYILTAMEKDGVTFADALEATQKMGYAESDPSLDIDGGDAAHKILLIARLAFGAHATMNDVPVVGVRDFKLRDIRYAAQFGFCVKLLAQAVRRDNGIELSVQPTLVPCTHPIASVDGAMNAILVRSAYAGETLYYGAGAGAFPTAAAVVADVIDIARGNGALAQHGNGTPLPSLIPADDCSAPHFLRLRVLDMPGVLANIASALAQQNISIEAIHQNESAPGQEVDIIMLVHEASRGKIFSGIKQIENQSTTVGAVVTMPIKRFL
jgi:homoserine dehydrogenase